MKDDTAKSFWLPLGAENPSVSPTLDPLKNRRVVLILGKDASVIPSPWVTDVDCLLTENKSVL